MMTVDRITPDELDQLQSLARRSFDEAFAWGNSRADMDSYLETAFSKEALSSELADPAFEFYFGRREERAVGYLAIRDEGVVAGRRSVEICRIYVLQEETGTGMGQLLWDKAMERAREMGAEWIWLGVWERNPRAIRFYERNGLQRVGEQTFQLGTDLQTDWIMGRSLP